jgi:hypothetical protein
MNTVLGKLILIRLEAFGQFIVIVLVRLND